jgi:hypothetical protein
MPVQETVLDCGESRTTTSLTLIPVALGLCGKGVFVFTGGESLEKRKFVEAVDHINAGAARCVQSGIPVPSFAMPADSDYHPPIEVYVGDEAIAQLAAKMRAGDYDDRREILTKHFLGAKRN